MRSELRETNFVFHENMSNQTPTITNTTIQSKIRDNLFKAPLFLPNSQQGGLLLILVSKHTAILGDFILVVPL